MADEEREDGPAADGDVVEPAPSADPSESPVSGDEPVEPASEQPPAAEPSPTPDPAAPAPAAASDEPTPDPAVPPAGTGQPATPPEPAATEPRPDPAAPAPADAGERQRRPRRKDAEAEAPREEVVPGAHLEPDLVLDEQRPEGEFGQYSVDEDDQPAAAGEQPAGDAQAVPAPTPMDLAADARYRATGKRKTAVARVILRPGTGQYVINGRTLEEFFPRHTLQLTARLPLETAGYATRMDVIARLHGGGVSSQAGALRHGVARALVEADPNLRGELKRRGFLTRDARVKERKKAGLKKARKRPQFSKR